MKRSTTRRRWFSWIVAVLAAGMLFQCSEDNPFAPNVRGDNEVWITANGYEPATLTVSAGTRVTWINKDDQNHTVDSGAPNQPTNLFSSPTIRTNGTFSFTFSTAGTFSYYCARTLATGRVIVN